MILQHKNAVIYGAGGSLAGAVAKALAAAGANVFLTGRHLPSVQQTREAIVQAGGQAAAAQVDALDEHAIRNHLGQVLQVAGSVDISFNAIDYQVVQNRPLVDISPEDFVRPVTIAMQTQFMTATAAARIMMQQGSGVILTLTATPGGIGYPYTGGFAPACAAIESLSRNLAAEAGPYGVRVVNIRSAGSPDSRLFKQALDDHPEEMAPILRGMEADTMLKQMPLMEDIAQAAVFLSSDLAGRITGVTIDVTAGTTAGLNYRAERKKF
jgi:NAD(P)-dependent dehydrogenase (short-subunit alcohol dehydrogenase family)